MRERNSKMEDPPPPSYRSGDDDPEMVDTGNEIGDLYYTERRPPLRSLAVTPRCTKVVARCTSSRRHKWWNEAELKRKKRVAKYKIYAMEGKVKASFKHGLRWIKEKYHKILGRT